MINVFEPALRAEELEAVKKVFESNWVGKGRVTDQFEAQFAGFLGVERNLIRSVSCCTEGLFQAMAMIGAAPGDEVILPTISFVGAANAVAAYGARPVFCDVDPRTLNPTAELMEGKITRRTKAVMILHYGGVPCDMDAISELVRERGLALVEDNACSVASRYRGKACGTFGDFGSWSFDAMKILVTGDGGMIFCKSPERAQQAEELVYLGLLSKSGFSTSNEGRWWEFEIGSFGRRAIMNDISSAIGLEQLKKLSAFIARRKQIHESYDRLLSDLTWLQVPPEIPEYVESSYYFYWLQLPSGVRDRLAKYLRENDIYTTFRYYPLHWVKLYDSAGALPNAETSAQETLCIPIHQSLTDSQVEKICDCVKAFGKRL
ncbi:MAG TPA: DegT/DnrJ/EryC1/StrS family aminotransferase [Methylomirabilota bacterium]|nr:DegT/DnrJ/EryC1/StrS family aminotransferase [Methylomirabilota bacterium]